jgi:NADP-dependent 3-hydroxy acid dehydrogenase YdfG
MINNAGLMPHSPLERLKIDDWNRMIDVNIKGALFRIRGRLTLWRCSDTGLELASFAFCKTNYAATDTMMRPDFDGCSTNSWARAI